MRMKEIGLPSTHQRHKSGNQPNYHHNISAMMDISRKGSVVQDDIMHRPSINKSKEGRPGDMKRFKF